MKTLFIVGGFLIAILFWLLVLTLPAHGDNQIINYYGPEARYVGETQITGY